MLFIYSDILVEQTEHVPLQTTTSEIQHYKSYKISLRRIDSQLVIKITLNCNTMHILSACACQF